MKASPPKRKASSARKSDWTPPSPCLETTDNFEIIGTGPDGYIVLFHKKHGIQRTTTPAHRAWGWHMPPSETEKHRLATRFVLPSQLQT